jgi:hypothetical protein
MELAVWCPAQTIVVQLRANCQANPTFLAVTDDRSLDKFVQALAFGTPNSVKAFDSDFFSASCSTSEDVIPDNNYTGTESPGVNKTATARDGRPLKVA